MDIEECMRDGTSDEVPVPAWVHTLRKRMEELEESGKLEEILRSDGPNSVQRREGDVPDTREKQDIFLLKVKAWRTGTSKGKRGSLAVTIPFQLAAVLDLHEGDILGCGLDFEERALRYRKC